MGITIDAAVKGVSMARRHDNEQSTNILATLDVNSVIIVTDATTINNIKYMFNIKELHQALALVALKGGRIRLPH